MKKWVILLLAIVWLQIASTASAQDAVPAEILGRTVPIRGATEQGTAFAIDYEGKVYEVTARHVMSGVAEQRPTNVQIRRNNQWLSLPVTRILYPASPDVDIAILETTIKAGPEGFSYVKVPEKPEKANMAFGQSVWFLGYPFLEGLGSKFNGDSAVIVPLVKKGVLSAVDASNPNAVLLYIDGFNNHGFSGGPIIYFDYTARKYFIAGVVKGYRYDNAEIMVNGKSVSTNVLVNSGILIGYSIEHVTETIKRATSDKQ